MLYVYEYDHDSWQSDNSEHKLAKQLEASRQIN